MKHKEQVLYLYNSGTIEYLTTFWKEVREQFAEDLIYKVKDEKTADLKRGAIEMLDLFIKLPERIENRMQWEQKNKALIESLAKEMVN